MSKIVSSYANHSHGHIGGGSSRSSGAAGPSGIDHGSSSSAVLEGLLDLEVGPGLLFMLNRKGFGIWEQGLMVNRHVRAWGISPGPMLTSAYIFHLKYRKRSIAQSARRRWTSRTFLASRVLADIK